MKFLRDPLVHFVILGAGLFVVYALVAGVFSSGDVRRIEIGKSEIEFLAGTFERQWGREPTPEELRRRQLAVELVHLAPERDEANLRLVRVSGRIGILHLSNRPRNSRARLAASSG